ncbi:MAG: hypothetical protein E7288_06465 [Lachnospiraceae bacterium]|nr:hypothetical protein [Lachnospiraceae bacterium]
MPNKEPVYQHNKLASTAKNLAITAIVTALLQTVILPYIFGGISIILAAISKGNTIRYTLNAKLAIWISIGTILLNTLFVGFTTYQLLFNDELKQQLNATYQQFYGMNYDEYIETMLNSYNFQAE